MDQLITAAEVRAWIEAHLFQDLTGFPNRRHFAQHFVATFGDRDLNEGAIEVLWQRYPRIMAYEEEHGEVECKSPLI